MGSQLIFTQSQLTPQAKPNHTPKTSGPTDHHKLEAEANILTPAEKLARGSPARRGGWQSSTVRGSVSGPGGSDAAPGPPVHGDQGAPRLPCRGQDRSARASPVQSLIFHKTDKCPKNFVFIIKPCSTNLKSKQTGNKPHEVFPLKGGVQSSANKLNVKL